MPIYKIQQPKMDLKNLYNRMGNNQEQVEDMKSLVIASQMSSHCIESQASLVIAS